MWATVAAALALGLLAGCAAEESESSLPAGFPTVANERFNGVFEVSEAADGGRDLMPGQTVNPMVEIDVVSGAAILDLSCNRRLGSFTFEGDGRASFTFTGGTEVDSCLDEERDAAILALFGRVDRWQSTDGGFALFGGGGDRLILIRG